MPTESDPDAPSGGNVIDKALGQAAEDFGKEIAPLGQKAGALVYRVGDLLIRALQPLVFGLEKTADWIHQAVTTRLKNVPQENIVAPNPRIAVPAMQALTYSIEDETIRDMFANLLAADMNSETKGKVHPAFVEMIKELSPVDARVLQIVARQPQIEFEGRFSAGSKWASAGYATTVEVAGVETLQIRRALSNLKRLEIVEARENAFPLIEGAEKEERDLRALAEPAAKELNEMPDEEKSKRGFSGNINIVVNKIGIYTTPLGQDFAAICTPEKA